MTKIGQIIRKNILLLTRSRSSAFVILFGPLVIILLIGLAFTSTAGADFAVGYHNPEPSALADTFVKNMEDSGFIVQSFSTVDECIDGIKQGALQTCIGFPANFSIENEKTNEIIFYVDESRTNFVYQIIDSISSNLGLATAELSQGLTDSILQVLWDTESGVDDAIEEVVKIKASTASVLGDADKATSAAADLDFESVDVDTDLVEGYFDTMTISLQNLRGQTDDFIDDSKALKSELDGNAYVGGAAYTDFLEALDDLENYTGDNEVNEETNVANFELAFEEMVDSLESMDEKLADAEEANEETIDKIGDLKKSAENIRDSLDDLKKMLEDVNSGIESLKVTSSETITNPITTTIEYVSGKNNKLSFMFPYLLMLVVMFVGLLLSGTLIIMEKKSKSSFRTFCTPIKDEVLMLGNFLTSFIVVLIQVAVIVGIAYYFLGDALLGNLGVAGLLLFLGVVFFIVLGMAIGYVLNSQEAVTMIAISLGSISLFLSNLILPLETLSGQLRYITSFNPYVITSEALRKALLFNAPHTQLTREIFSLIGYSIGIFIVLVIIRHIMKSKFYQNMSFTRKNKIFEDPSDMYLKVEGHDIKNLRDFMLWLEAVDDRMLDRELSWKDISEWMKKNHMSKMLRVRLAGKKREEMITSIEKYLDKVRKT